MSSTALLALAALCLVTAPAAAATRLDSLLRSRPADSLVAPLRQLEMARDNPRMMAEAAVALGRLHYARGEYRHAAEAFSRAAARFDPSRKPEARYWEGLCWLALREPGPARALLEEVARTSARRRGEALLGVAFAWEQAKRPEQAFEVLEKLVDEDRGDAAPAALERLIVLSQKLHREDVVEGARARLARDYPQSIEAARAGVAPASSPVFPAKPTRAFDVQIGIFPKAPSARDLATRARTGGFPGARVVAREESGTVRWAVRLGPYPSQEEARAVGERAKRKLGVAYRLVESR